jgi:DNA-binding transcriptional LysR family regulator
MSIVLAVAEAGSVSATARRLNTPPATASRKITDLKEHLRTKLFDPSARRLMLTDAGSSYVAALKRILADISETERATAGEYTAPTGELIVTAPVGQRGHGGHLGDWGRRYGRAERRNVDPAIQIPSAR